MNSILSILMAAAQLIPTAVTVVQAVETAMPAGTPGATKLAAVQATMGTAYSSIQTVETAFVNVWPVLNSFITVLINNFNALGIFKHTSPAAAGALPSPSPAPATVSKAG